MNKTIHEEEELLLLGFRVPAGLRGSLGRITHLLLSIFRPFRCPRCQRLLRATYCFYICCSVLLANTIDYRCGDRKNVGESRGDIGALLERS
jgi:hypothetical protein